MSKKHNYIEVQFYNTLSIKDLPEMSPKVVVKAIAKGNIRSNGRSVQPCNVLTLKYKYPKDTHFDDAINSFLTNTVSGETLINLQKLLKPEYVFLRLHVPAQSSKWIQDSFIKKETLVTIAELNLDLDFWFT